jgi:hypothetical protein
MVVVFLHFLRSLGGACPRFVVMALGLMTAMHCVLMQSFASHYGLASFFRFCNVPSSIFPAVVLHLDFMGTCTMAEQHGMPSQMVLKLELSALSCLFGPYFKGQPSYR